LKTRALALLRAALLLVACALALVARPRGAVSAPVTASARGLDLWVHGPSTVRSGSTLRLSVQALGFPRLASLVALDGAEIVASWDPESLAEKADTKPAAAPPPVITTTDAEGRATISLVVPEGPQTSLRLVLTLRHGDKERTRELSVVRTATRKLRLFVSDEEVVPGSEVAVWAYATDSESEQPLAGESIDIELLEGGVVRHRRQGRTDASGTLLTRMPIPRDDTPGLSWQLSAELGRGWGGVSARTKLSVREERPGSPRLSVSFERGSLAPKETTPWELRLHDAAGSAVAAQPVWVWTGPRGTTAPAEREAFEKAAKRHVTDADGHVRGELVAPANVPLRGSEIAYVARTVLDGQSLEIAGRVSVAQAQASVSFTPEAGELVPGLEQSVHVAIYGEGGRPVRGRFELRGDGLSTTLETDDRGEGRFTWKAPRDLGAKREVGPCSGQVAAALSLRPIEATLDGARFTGELAGADGRALCVPVDREAAYILRPAESVVRAGQELELRIVGQLTSPAAVLLRGEQGGETATAWLDRGADRLRMRIPESAFGLTSFDLATAEGTRPSRLARARVLALPRSIPKLEGKLVGGRAAPLGEVTLLAKLSDGSGKPLQGSIAAVVVDAYGGGNVSSLLSLDAGSDLCSRAGVSKDDCEPFLRGSPAEQARYAPHFEASRSDALTPPLDPGATLERDVAETFRAVVHSLEGALYEASHDPARLPDVRRVTAGRHSFNPELMRLVTDALDTPPQTPGGEPVALADLVSIDPQITYDHVARRVTRLKLFEVLSAVRALRQDENIDSSEPVFKEPNALLRKLVREGKLEEGKLSDPWGGRIQFVPSRDEPVPFISVVRGFELRSPGPDGRAGTADDVRSPFERVLRAGSPYALATDEERVVDARWDMRVADSTVDAWSALLKEATGTELGGIGLGSIGTIGHGTGSGSGYGSGSGRLGGAHRTSFGVAKGLHHVAPPARTDQNGELRITVPLGAEETTWRVALVGMPDGARPATTWVDVPSSLPLSVKVEAGARWVVGDRGEALVQLRNRTERALEVSLAIEGEGGLRSTTPSATLSVPARGAASLRVPLEAASVGEGALRLRATAPGVPADQLVHRLEIQPNGELVRVARTVWLEPGQSIDLAPWMQRAQLVPVGPAEIVVEQGERRLLEAALSALEPRHLEATNALADAMLAAGLIRDRALRTGGDESPLARRASDVIERAEAKLRAITNQGDGEDRMLADLRRLRRDEPVTLVKPRKGEKEVSCPSDDIALGAPAARVIPWLDAEPIMRDGMPRECWTKLVAAVTNRVISSRDPELLARGALALSTSPQRTADARVLFDALEERVLGASVAQVSLPNGASRAARATVLAALIVGSEKLGGPERARLASQLAVQRDARGSYGSPEATRAAVQAFVHLAAKENAGGASGAARFSVAFDEAPPKEQRAGESRVSVPVAEGARRAEVRALEGKLVARIERTFLRPFTVPAEPSPSPIAFTLRWPEASRGEVAILRADLFEPSGERSGHPVRAQLRIPLPPGASLAAPVDGVRQVQGALRISRRYTGRETLGVPIRFALAGSYTLPEATATSPDAPATIARAASRPLVVRERPERAQASPGAAASSP